MDLEHELGSRNETSAGILEAREGEKSYPAKAEGVKSVQFLHKRALFEVKGVTIFPVQATIRRPENIS